jgi:hypothetical protein
MLRNLIFSLTLLSTFLSLSFAQGVAELPATVKVQIEDGSFKIYTLNPKLSVPVIDSNKDFGFHTPNGFISRCPPYLGSLAEDFSFVIIENGKTTKYKVEASNKSERTVSVFGTCGNESNPDMITEEFVINIKSGNGFTIEEN